MTDELKPELKEAMKNMPRERMPSGLEAKVTGAMRDHGFLRRRRRTVAVTGGRVAGLLAACVALMIGAYSIGLHRGGGDAVLPSAVAPAQRNAEEAKLEEPTASGPPDMGNVVAEESATGPAKRQEAKSPPPEQSVSAEEKPGDDRLAHADAERRVATPESGPEPEVREERVLSKRPADAQSVERTREKDRVAEGLASADEAAPAREALTSQPQAPSPAPSSVTPRMLPVPLLMLGDLPVVVDAPDSVRVTQDERGQMILIYTSDGIIRIRPAHNN